MSNLQRVVFVFEGMLITFAGYELLPQSDHPLVNHLMIALGVALSLTGLLPWKENR